MEKSVSKEQKKSIKYQKKQSNTNKSNTQNKNTKLTKNSKPSKLIRTTKLTKSKKPGIKIQSGGSSENSDHTNYQQSETHHLIRGDRIVKSGKVVGYEGMPKFPKDAVDDCCIL